MKTKEEIVANWLPRYTKRNLEDFGEYILLTNFNKYVEIFANQFNVPILGRDANMISASAEGITMINFGMGSPNAAIIMDLLGAIRPKACLFLGKCGGIDKKNQLGDLILPIAAIRGEGTYDEREFDDDYYTQPGKLWRLMTPADQQATCENTARAMGDSELFIKQRHVRNCYNADPSYGEGVARALGISLAEALTAEDPAHPAWDKR